MAFASFTKIVISLDDFSAEMRSSSAVFASAVRPLPFKNCCAKRYKALASTAWKAERRTWTPAYEERKERTEHLMITDALQTLKLAIGT